MIGSRSIQLVALILLTCHSAAAVWSCQTLLSFLTMFAGQFSNEGQVKQTESTVEMWLKFTYVPVNVSALHPAVTFYYEQHVNNNEQPARQQIYAFTLRQGCFLQQSVYNINDSTRFSRTDKDSLRALNDLDISELTNRPVCDARWRFEREGVFLATLATPEKCTFPVNGIQVYPNGFRELTCNMLSVTEKFVSSQGGTVVAGSNFPYLLQKLENNRYSFPVDTIACCGFQDPCNRSRRIRR